MLYDINKVYPKVGDKVVYAKNNSCNQMHICVGTVTEVTDNCVKIKRELDGRDLYMDAWNNPTPDKTAEVKFDVTDSIKSRRHCSFVIIK